jgi:FkbM family methyltransferase
MSRTLLSLIADEVAARTLIRIRRRAARNDAFFGITVPINDPISVRLLATGKFEATQIDGLDQLIKCPADFGLKTKPSGVFIDVGANIGLFSLAFAHHFDRVLSIEANPKTFSILQTNLALKDIVNVDAICVAASDDERRSHIFAPADGSLGGVTMNPNEHGAEASAIEIQCQALDKIIEERGYTHPIGMIKIDVEGHEHEVMKGAINMLRLHRPLVLFEALNAPRTRACLDTLIECGYSRCFSFRRGSGHFVADVMTGLRSGLKVSLDELNINESRRSPMLCVV